MRDLTSKRRSVTSDADTSCRSVSPPKPSSINAIASVSEMGAIGVIAASACRASLSGLSIGWVMIGVYRGGSDRGANRFP